MQALLDCADEAMQGCDRPKGLVFLSPGNTVAWDNCCDGPEGGQLWVRLVSMIPQPVASQVCDIHAVQVRLALGVLQCVHGLTDEGFPAASDMTQDTLDITKDSMILLNAIRCCQFTRAVFMKTLKIEQGLPLGPQGMCGGFEWTLTFQMGLCDAGCS